MNKIRWIVSISIALFTMQSFAISPGAGQAQTRNNMQTMQQNQKQMQQVRKHAQQSKQNLQTMQKKRVSKPVNNQ